MATANKATFIRGMKTSDVEPEGYKVRCSKCMTPFECRTNLLNGKPTWFPTCKHDAAWGEVYPFPLGQAILDAIERK